MTELHAGLGIHRLVDRAVQEDPSLRDAAAELFPCYRDGATGWTDAFGQVLVDGRKVESVDAAFQDPDEALDHFIENEPPHAWDATRRVQLLAAASRVHPAFGPGGEHAERTQAALRHVVHPETGSPEIVHQLLATPGVLTHDTWSLTVSGLAADGYVHPTMQQHPAPCASELIPVAIHGEDEPVTVLRTWTARDDHDVADMGNLLDPSRWPDCPGFWCAMTHERDEGLVEVYLEEVATDCSPGPWLLCTRLNFLRKDWPGDIKTVDYWLSDDDSPPSDGLVEVDEGSILVRPKNADGSGVIVSTTKRLRFNGPMDGAQLAMTACALGWEGAGDRFMFGCDEGTQK